jgi:hypothetical protein
MRFSQRYFVVVTVVVVGILAAPLANARLTRAWTPEELRDESDFIGIIEPIANETVGEKLTIPLTPSGQLKLPGVNTRFHVEMTLKVTRASFLEVIFFWRRKPPEEVVVLHFQETDAALEVANGPNLVNFPLAPVEYEKRTFKDKKEIANIHQSTANPQYLAFLRRRADGRYEPTTGQEDAMDSFRELHIAISSHP